MVTATNIRQRFSDRLNRLLDEVEGFPKINKGRQVQLAKDMGVSQKGARKWLVGEAMPRREHIAGMSLRYGWDAFFLEFGDDGHIPRDRSTDKTAFSPNVASVSRVKGTIPLIDWISVLEWPGSMSAEKKEEFLKSYSINKFHTDDAYCLEVEGDSMVNPNGRPSFHNGDIIVVEPLSASEASNGTMIIAEFKDHSIPANRRLVFKTLVIEGRRKYLKSLNPAYLPIQDDFDVVGVVIAQIIE